MFDIRGRRIFVRSFTDLNGGVQSLRFGGRDDTGRELPSGVYMYRVTSAGIAREGKMIIAR